MSKELDNAFVDVRNAFRLLAMYQFRALDIVGYIREHTPFTDMWGRRLFCDTLHRKGGCPDGYANLAVWSDMWSWDFLYNYLFEYYFGQVTIQRKIVEMSVIQVSDDGFYKSHNVQPSAINIETYAPSTESNSLIVLTAGHNAWLQDYEEDDCDAFLHKFLASEQESVIFKDEKGGWAITKKYPIQRFSSQRDADKVLSDFGRIIKENAGIDLFKFGK